ncbi:MAG TPA: helix-turn-helix domain-containing protein [Solirubrobacteraceae bacterium]|nr:helix-turn-helix domain-containing protein [Solirubrobacteraceae bacterium]
MTSTDTTDSEESAADALRASRQMRADARRNYDKVVAAARDAFAEGGVETSLEGIARRAGVGIGTLYRHFPTRQALLEAVYVGEVNEVCRSAEELRDLPPWDAFTAWVQKLVGYLATKQALAAELLNYVSRDSELFRGCRGDLFAAGQPLLARAQAAGMLREDTDIGEIVQLIGGIAKIQTTEPGQRDHILQIALDGLRKRA